jgi:hypothetical protein
MLCHAIIDPPRVRHHLSKGMRLTAIHHTKIARELATLWAAVPTTVESVLGHSPSDTYRVEVVDEMAAEFEKMEDRHSRLEWPAARIYDLVLGTPPGRAWLADLLDEAAGHLRVELAA